MTADSRPPSDRRDSQVPPQRSTRAPAEGADPRAGTDFDHSAADGDGQAPERSPREPAEGKPDAAPSTGD